MSQGCYELIWNAHVIFIIIIASCLLGLRPPLGHAPYNAIKCLVLDFRRIGCGNIFTTDTFVFGPIALLTRSTAVRRLALGTLGQARLLANNTRQLCRGCGITAASTRGVHSSYCLLVRGRRENFRLFPSRRRCVCLCVVHCTARTDQVASVNDHAPIFLLLLPIAAVVLGAVQCVVERHVAGHLQLPLLLCFFLLSYFHHQPHTSAKLIVVE